MTPIESRSGLVLAYMFLAFSWMMVFCVGRLVEL